MKFLKKLLRRFIMEEKGQVSIEYTLLISSIVIAMIGATYPLIGETGIFASTINRIMNNLSEFVSTGRILF